MARLPVIESLSPLGKFSSRDLARAALLSALLRAGDWWGEPLAAQWGELRRIPLGVVRELLDELVAQGRVEIAASVEAKGCLRWRAQGAT